MARRDIGTDDPRVRVRPGRGSRPRTKVRPDYSNHPIGWVKGVARGRYEVIFEGRELLAVKARELGRHGVIIGDRVRLEGDLSGRRDTLARIVAVNERTSVLMRSPEEGDAKGRERPMVANADNLVIVTALADPPPREGMIDRCLIAAYAANMRPILVLTKTDLADGRDFIANYTTLGVQTFAVHAGADEAEQSAEISQLREFFSGQTSVFIGHSGVGKTTLLNALIPGTNRLTGQVNENTGRGRHTTTQALAFALPAGGFVIDTPGVRSFGLAHVEVADVLAAFPELAQAAAHCPRNCEHLADQGCALDESESGPRLARVRSLLETLQVPQWQR